MKIYVGTSGWMYSWNPDRLEWYVARSGLNAIELNMSFYRFPRHVQVERWARIGAGLRWAVKVHRSITHYRKLSPASMSTLSKFIDRFRPLEHLIDFYLFQLPPSLPYSEKAWERVVAVNDATGGKAAIEPRHLSWFNDGVVKKFAGSEIVLVTPDSPDYAGTPQGKVYCSSGTVYLRMHGRTAWYVHRYTQKELEEVARMLCTASPSRAYIFFNNDHDMLDNARQLKQILIRDRETSLLY